MTIDENDKVLNMTEKSLSHWCCPPFYYYTREDAKLVQKGIDSGCVLTRRAAKEIGEKLCY